MNETIEEQQTQMIGPYSAAAIKEACLEVNIDPSEIGLFGGGEGCCSKCDGVDANDMLKHISNDSALKHEIAMVGMSAALPPVYAAQSQKAVGVLRLGAISRTETKLARGTAIYSPKGGKVFSSSGNERPMPDYPIFARPCPMRPRHGFVDSRVIKDEAEWDALLAEIAKCDEPDCEILLMRPVDAASSAIVSSGGVTLGPGNDGATSGHGALTIPSISENVTYQAVGESQESFGVKDSPYMEYVFDEGTHLVQVRDGPRVALTQRYIPAETTVTEIIEAGGDLMEWEKLIDALPFGGSGVVVHHPGGSMASHYSVHCVLRGVPVICEDEAPKVGDKLEPTGDTFTPSLENLKQFRAAFDAGWETFKAPPALGDSYKNPELVSAMNFGVGSVHSWGVWQQVGFSEAQMNMLGYGVAALLRVSAWSLNGETRHWGGSGPGRFRSGEAVETLGHLRLRPARYNEQSQGCETRAEAYRAMAGLNAAEMQKVCVLAREDFTGAKALSNYGWSGAFGGKKWGLCADATLRAFDAIATAQTTDDADALGEVVVAMNAIINSAHNGGFFLNKFIDGNLFDRFARCPSLAFIDPVAYSVATGEPTGTPDDWAQLAQAEAVCDEAKAALRGRQIANAREMWRIENPADIADAIAGYQIDSYYWHKALANVFYIPVAVEPEPVVAEPVELVEVGGTIPKAAKVGTPVSIDETPKTNSYPIWSHLVGKQWAAQYQVRGTKVKLQAKTPPVNRPYGVTFSCKVESGDVGEMYEKWINHSSKTPSLADTEMMYAPCILTVNEEGSMTVQVDGCEQAVMQIKANVLVNQ